jgi:hypothetical protein
MASVDVNISIRKGFFNVVIRKFEVYLKEAT